MAIRALSLVAIGAALVAYFQAVHPQRPLREKISFSFNERVATYPASFIRLTSFGYAHSAAALLWIRFLQHTPIERVRAGELSWLYQDLNTLTDLDPRFSPAYQQGGIFLSVITEDKVGAERLMQKGRAEFPQNWRIAAYLAYHYQFELNDPEKARDLYLEASALPGASALVQVLASSAMARRRGTGPALELLRSFLRDTKDPAARKRIEDKIRKLEKESA